MLTRRRFVQATGLAAAYAAMPGMFRGSAHAAAPAAANLSNVEMWAATTAPPNADILHLLNRITYGPRQGEVSQVARLGYEAFLDQQLHPERIDDSAMATRLSGFKGLKLTNAQLLQAYSDERLPHPWELSQELERAALLRAIYSKRQLYEVMVDFWTNHFNIYIHKDECRWYKVSDDRDVIRRHALGKFRDMLHASAKSPAMLVFLDNRNNISPPPERDWLGGVNENYGRELLELHTVGSTAGYTETDVQAVARAFTGWTLDNPWSEIAAERANPGSFRFQMDLHDKGQKRIPFLGLTLPVGGGITEGQTILTRLANHPRTAQRIAHKLCVRFVSDNPPAALVDRIARAFITSDTDIRATLGVLLRSPEFKAAKGTKVKQPVRAFVSYVRALGTNVTQVENTHWQFVNMGQPFFEWDTPDGWPQPGAAWTNTGSMLSRWNAAHALADNWAENTFDYRRFVPPAPVTPERLVDFAGQKLLNGPVPTAARSVLIQYVGVAGEAIEEEWLVKAKTIHLLGLILGSPAFQVH